MVNQLLTKIDGVDALNNILLIGMTNRKDMLDEALMRPGRLEVQIEIGLPDNAGREQILKVGQPSVHVACVIWLEGLPDSIRCKQIVLSEPAMQAFTAKLHARHMSLRSDALHGGSAACALACWPRQKPGPLPTASAHSACKWCPQCMRTEVLKPAVYADPHQQDVH